MSTISEQERADTLRKIAVMQAYVDGKEIEMTSHGDLWVRCDFPTWNWSDKDYRVKPEPRAFWVNIYDSGVLGRAYMTKEEAENGAIEGHRNKCIKVREVVE
jgi:hypothetical protein